MPKFDYVQIRTESSYVVLDSRKFDITPAKETPDGLLRMRLKARTRKSVSERTNIPINRVKVDVVGPYTTIGISSKILGIDYKELITSKTFESCLTNFVKVGLLEDIDVSSIRDGGKLTALEVTKDYQLEESPTLKDFEILSKAVVNPFRWNPKVYNNGGGGGGLSLMKIVKEDKEFLSVYDKFIEMNLQRMRKFNDTYGNPFNKRGSIRGEAKLLSARSIRNRFGTNSLLEVLNSEKEPLKILFEKLFINEKDIVYSNKLNKAKLNNLKFASLYDNNAEKIAKVISSDERQKHNRVRRFRDIMDTILMTDIDSEKSLKFLHHLKNFN